MKHFIKILFFILVPYFAFSQSLGKNAGKTRLAPTTQLRKGTKPNQILMTRQSDTSLVYSDLDTILQNNIRNTDIKLLFSVVNDSIRIDSFNNVLGVIVGTPQYIDNVVNKADGFYTLTSLDDTLALTTVAASKCPALTIAKLDSCNVAYLYMFNCSTNSWEVFKTPNVYTAGKTLFVDEVTGNDATAKKGCPTCAFKTIDAALSVIDDGDLLKINAGNYTSSLTVTKGFNIDCANGVNWNIINPFISACSYSQPLTWKFDNLYHIGDRLPNYYITELPNLSIYANILDNVGIGGFSNNASTVINNCIDCFVASNSLSGVGNNRNIIIKNTKVTKTGFVLSDNWSNNNDKSFVDFYNIKCDFNVQGHGMVNYNYATDAGINKNYTLNIENIEFNPTSQYSTAPSVFSNSAAWGIQSNPTTIVGYARAGWTDGTVINAKIRNFSGTGHGYGVDGGHGATNGKKYLYYKVQGHFKKGFPFFSRSMQNIQNATIVIDFDVECDEGIGCFIGINDTDTNPTCKFILRGRIKTNGKPCIAIAGNSNSTVTLDNLTMINIGGTYSVESNQNNSIIVKPGCASNVTTSANVTQLGTGIYVDPNFNN